MHRHTLRDTAHIAQTAAKMEKIVNERNLRPSAVSDMARILASVARSRAEMNQDGPYTVVSSEMHVHLHVLEASR